MLEQGEIVLFPFPFSDQRRAKLRPAIVVSNDSYNRGSRDVIACGLTTNLANAAHSVLIEPRDLTRGTLVATSRAKADKIFALDQALVKRRLGTVKPAIVAALRKELVALL